MPHGRIRQCTGSAGAWEQPAPVPTGWRALAAAVLLDAFILRTLLVPALMHLSGRANWWLPGWLDRALPHLSIEPATEPPAPPSPAPAPARQATHAMT